jgi:mono/diheme cytochrome c family protein
MRFSRLGPVLFLVFVALYVAAENKTYEPDPNWKAPPKEAEMRNPLKGNSAAIRKGHDLFEDQCSMCHGSDGKGLTIAANFHKPAVQAEPDGTLFWKITNGHPQKGMPSFKKLSENERWSLVDYLRTFATKN